MADRNRVDLDALEETLRMGISPTEQAKRLIAFIEMFKPPGTVLHGALKVAIIVEVNAVGGVTPELRQRLAKTLHDWRKQYYGLRK